MSDYLLMGGYRRKGPRRRQSLVILRITRDPRLYYVVPPSEGTSNATYRYTHAFPLNYSTPPVNINHRGLLISLCRQEHGNDDLAAVSLSSASHPAESPAVLVVLISNNQQKRADGGGTRHSERGVRRPIINKWDYMATKTGKLLGCARVRGLPRNHGSATHPAQLATGLGIRRHASRTWPARLPFSENFSAQASGGCWISSRQRCGRCALHPQHRSALGWADRMHQYLPRQPRQ